MISIATGIISSFISTISVYIMTRDTSVWTISMTTTLLWISSIVSFVLFIGTGIYCFNDMTREEIARSALIVSAYYLIILLLEQSLLANGYYLTLMSLLFIPVDIYSVLHTILLRTTNINIFIAIIPSILMHFIYTLFGIKENVRY
ncbi:hypothetical protein K8M07_04200 [Schnuerera sp. xch1]|uniref:hypothetical protein n=1 Tax=Schnuerera sp. xch1 TaxID=2874283 RepID=UPI001CC0A3CD|nr:hypothetical protein [Schnuerera sp. xch1]MBZ2174444.1 hypothetical protein [Schnuerera sp. xch1]